jgi:F-type H+-transporting ATPase subunit b
MPMFQHLTYLASEAASSEASGDLFGSLGINWQMLIFQMLAFIVLVVLLGKFVFPVLMKAVDDRQAKIEEAAGAAEQAEKKAEEAQSKIEETLKKARSEAADIVSTAKSEATQMVEKAEKQAATRSERIVAEAQEEIAKDVLAARKTLEKDTIMLVKKAAGLAIVGIADEKLDTALIKKSVESAKR